jgi:hypothetical protein
MFKRTLLRLLAKLRILKASYWIPLFFEGVAIELERVNDFKKKVLKSVVPNSNMDTDSLDDYIKKYGLEYLDYLPITITDEQKINFCIEAAALSGHSGPEWLQDQLQKAGFDFYVFKNDPSTDPSTIAGELVVGTHPTGGLYDILSVDSSRWGFFLVLSPFDDHVASASELTEMTLYEFQIIRKLIINLKFQRDWIILQVDYSQYLDGEKWLDGSWYLDGIGTEV